MKHSSHETPPSERPPGGSQRLRVRLFGRVQGVGFRAFTRRAARRYGLAGYVRNVADGSVEVVAEGPVDDLNALLQALSEGPPGADVREMEQDWLPATGDSAPFEIRY